MNNRSNVALSLCMDFSSGGSELKPLTNAEFHRLLANIDRYNGGGENVQLTLDGMLSAGGASASAAHRPASGAFGFESLPEVDAGFMERELSLGGGLAEKIATLLKRSVAVAFEMERLDGLARIVTFFDEGYPAKLRDGLSKLPDSYRAPALLYHCGDLSLQKLKFAGFVGARDAGEDDKAWTEDAVGRIGEKAKRAGDVFGVVSGGSEGIDRISENAALRRSMPVIEFSKNMRASLKDPETIDAIQRDEMLLFSEVNPLRALSRLEATAHFMNRNKYIYAMSEYTIVVKSAMGPKSGTWSGAEFAIKNKLCKVYVRDTKDEGNIGLIRLGGTPL